MTLATHVQRSLSHSRDVSHKELVDKVDRACKELGLPPVTFYPVDFRNLTSNFHTHIIRETELPEPYGCDRDLDLAYLSPGRSRRRSLEINAWAFDDPLLERFTESLKRKGLTPRIEILGPFAPLHHNDNLETYRKFEARTPRYTSA